MDWQTFWEGATAFVLAIIGALQIWERISRRHAEAEQLKELKAVAEKVEVVHHATNSLVDRLVEKTEKEGIARGTVDERARAEAESVRQARLRQATEPG